MIYLETRFSEPYRQIYHVTQLWSIDHQPIGLQVSFSFFLFILPYALTDILGRLAKRLLVQDSKKRKNDSTDKIKIKKPYLTSLIM